MSSTHGRQGILYLYDNAGVTTITFDGYTGNISTDTIDTTGDVNIGGTLNAGATTLSGLTVNGVSTFNGNVNVGTMANPANFTVNGNTTLGRNNSDTLTINSTPTFVSGFTTNGNATFNGGIVTSSLVVNGTSTFNDHMQVNRKICLGLNSTSSPTQKSICFHSVPVGNSYTLAAVDDAFGVPIRLALDGDPGTQRRFQIGYYTGNTWNNNIDFNSYTGHITTQGGITLGDTPITTNGTIQYDGGFIFRENGRSFGLPKLIYGHIDASGNVDYSVGDNIIVTHVATGVYEVSVLNVFATTPVISLTTGPYGNVASPLPDLRVTGTLFQSSPGIYIIRYNVRDTAGNLTDGGVYLSVQGY